MALSESSRLPNLKICIDNEESDGDEDTLSLTDEAHIDLKEEDAEKDITSSFSKDEVSDSSGVGHAGDADDEVQFNVYLNKIEPKPAEPPTIRVYKYYISYFELTSLVQMIHP